MGFIYNAAKIRIAVVVGQTDNLLSVIDGGTPQIYTRGSTRFELAFFRKLKDATLQLLDPSNFSTVRLEIKSNDDRNAPAVVDRTVANTAINAGLTQEQWDDGSDQHVLVPLTYLETNLDLESKQEKEFWLILSAWTTDAIPALLPLGTTQITFVESGIDPTTPLLSTPVGSNLIPPASVYDGTGHFTVNVQSGKTYRFNPGVNEVTLTNGSEVYAAQSLFVAVAGTVQLLGIAPASAVTGSINYPIVYTADEADARFGSGFLKTVNDPNVKLSLRSASGTKIRTFSVDDDGNRVDTITTLTNP